MAIFTKIRLVKENQNGRQVNKNSQVKFKTFQENDSPGQFHCGNLNLKQFSPQLVSVLVDMKEGQKIQLKVINNGNEQSMFLEVIQVKDGQQFKEGFQQAQILKNKGNQYIKAKNYQQAARAYSQGLNLIEYDCSPQSQAVKTSLFSNLTLAFLNTKKYQQCLKMCDQYLGSSLQPNKKIVYRRANANKNLKRWQEAENDITFGLQICKQDDQGKKDLQALSQMIRKQKKIQSIKQKQLYSKMFG